MLRFDRLDSIVGLTSASVAAGAKGVAWIAVRRTGLSFHTTYKHYE